MCCEALIHASYSPQEVNEQWILNVFQEGLSLVEDNKVVGYLYNAVVSALSAQPVANINLMFDLFFQGVVNSNQDLLESYDSLFEPLLNKRLPIDKEIVEKFIHCCEKHNNERMRTCLS